MISYRHITKIIGVMMAAAVAFCFWLTAFSQEAAETLGGVKIPMEYEAALFTTDAPIQIDIQMAQDQWEEMLKNAMAEEYYACDVLINDRKLCNVGIRPKGNTSLSAIAMDPDTDRFSLKLAFDQYVEGQTCFGLDKLILNNNYADATNMKEAVIYDMYRYLGVDASLYQYAEISLNGEYLGVYLALEAVEDSFLMRNYGAKDGELYKPESMDRGGDFRREEFGGRNGANLIYTGDELSSYSDIWEGEVTNTGRADHDRVVTALKHISEGTDLEKYLDVDNVLQYMAVHVFSVNLDSLSGNMAHNYYLYESDGMLNILPWDYNLSFGGMNQGPENSASDVVNDAVDTPFPGTTFFDALLKNEEYLSRYHEYLRRLAQEYVLNGRFEEVYRGIRSRIDGLVKTDPTAFYSYEEYEAGAEMLYRTVMLRAESVKGQLDGTIPATDEEQRADAAGLVDASEIDISVMGVMEMEGGAMPKGKSGVRFLRGGKRGRM